jgi:hypothetical protein
MLLVERRVAIVMTGLVRLIATLVHHVVSIVIRVLLVVTVMIVLAGLIVIHAHRVLQRKSVQMKLKVALANDAQVAKCLCHPSVLVKIGWTKVLFALHVKRQVLGRVQRELVVRKRVDVKKFVHLIRL